MFAFIPVPASVVQGQGRRVDLHRRDIGVYNIKAVVCGNKANHRQFFHSVGDFIPVRVVFGRGKGIVPLAMFVRGDGDFLHHNISIFEPHGDGFGQDYRMAAQLPGLFAFDFRLHRADVGVGGGDGNRLSGQGGAGAVFQREGIAVLEIVVLPHFVLRTGGDFKLFAFAGL